MFKDLHIAHLTGTATVHHTSLLNDVIEFNRPRRTIGQMFFKPYESKNEYIFCLRNTLPAMVIAGLSVIAPLTLPLYATAMLGVSAVVLLVAALSKCLGNDSAASIALAIAEDITSRLIQTIINIIVLPLSTLAMITRGISTGLKAADIYDYDAADEDVVDEECSLSLSC